MNIRPAHNHEADPLSELALRSKAYWGYDAAFLDACRDELRVIPDTLLEKRVTVAEDGGHILGFYSLSLNSSTTVELDMLFIEPGAIGRGVGRILWEHAVRTARSLGYQELYIQSDPFAEPFYLRMGAIRAGETPSGSIPGRMLPWMRFDL